MFFYNLVNTVSLSDLWYLHKAKTLEMYSFEELASETLFLEILMVSSIYAITLLFTFDFNWDNFSFLIDEAVFDEESLDERIESGSEEPEANGTLRHRQSFFQASDPHSNIQTHPSLRI